MGDQHGMGATQRAYERARKGHPVTGVVRDYFHTAYDSTIAPPGKHTMRVFASTRPIDWPPDPGSRRREEIGGTSSCGAVARFAPEVRRGR